MKVRPAVLTGAIAFFCAACALAQSYPLKPVRVVLPVPAGGIQDGLARAMAPELGRRWGQTEIGRAHV